MNTINIETKKLLSKRMGIPFVKLAKMDDAEIEKLIEEKTGKKIVWPKGAKNNPSEKDCGMDR